MHTTLNSELIQKESISQLTFKCTTSSANDPNLLKQLEEATGLGNIEKMKYHIEFETESGPKSVETTIWATGNQFICLKGGRWIPIKCIKSIRSI